MQYKTLAALLFATAVSAAPKPADSSETSDSDASLVTPTTTIVIPESIEAAIESAAPTTWLMSIYEDPAFASSELDAIESGDLPDWASTLPTDVIAWATSEAAVLGGSSMSSIAVTTGPASSSADATGTTTSGGSSSTGSSADSSSGTVTSGAASSDAASSSAAASSAAAAESTSSAGAPAATGGIAMSFAGAAGILGVALAL